MTRDRTAERPRAYEAIRSDAEALAFEMRRCRFQRAGAERPPLERIDLSLIRHFQLRLAGNRSRWETVGAAG